MSHRLAEAERRLGVALFSRGDDRRLTPTRNGQVIHQAATRALAELRRGEVAVVSSPPAVELTLRIGVAGYDAYQWFPHVRQAVQVERPDIDLDLVIVDDSPADSLHRREADIVLAIGEPSGSLTLVDLFEDDLVLVCAPSHPLASQPVVEAVDLVSETLFTYNASPSPGFEYHRFVGPSGHSPRLVRVIRQTAAIVELVAAGTGVSILSRWATEPAWNAGRIATVQCGAAGLPIQWRAATRPNDTTAASVAELLGTLL